MAGTRRCDACGHTLTTDTEVHDCNARSLLWEPPFGESAVSPDAGWYVKLTEYGSRDPLNAFRLLFVEFAQLRKRASTMAAEADGRQHRLNSRHEALKQTHAELQRENSELKERLLAGTDDGEAELTRLRRELAENQRQVANLTRRLERIRQEERDSMRAHDALEVFRHKVMTRLRND